MQDVNITKRNEKLAQTVIKNLEKRNFEAYYCASKEDVTAQITSLVSKDKSISWGGSMTLDEIKIKDYLEAQGYKTINRDKAATQEEKQDCVLKSLTCDTFLMSANAVSLDGELVNIDGLGNRLAALCFGPRQVIIIVGINKIVKTLDDAISRARNFAAPVNAQRVSNFIDVQTPCLTTGICHDCKSETSVCSQVLITRLCRPKGRLKVILVNDELGY